jgi:hypothetical protein
MPAAKRFLTRTWKSDQDDVWAEYALITINTALAEQIRKAAWAFKQVETEVDLTLSTMMLWDSTPTFLSWGNDDKLEGLIGPEKNRHFTGYRWVEVPLNFDVEDEGFDYSAVIKCRLTIMRDGFFWTAGRESNTDLVESEKLPFAVLDNIGPCLDESEANP